MLMIQSPEMDDCRKFETFPFGYLRLPTFQISQSGFHQIYRTIDVYFAEPDQWSNSILVPILHCLIQRLGLNQAMRWMTTI
jgi:hypothetical protein